MNPQTTQQAIANHLDRDPVALVVGECDQCGPDRPIRVFMGVRQCGNCGVVQGIERE